MGEHEKKETALLPFDRPEYLERIANSLQPGDTTVLELDMTFHMIIGIWLDDWGLEMSETFRVTEDGAPEVFSHVPRQVLVKV